jgi:hypothetical protein
VSGAALRQLVVSQNMVVPCLKSTQLGVLTPADPNIPGGEAEFCVLRVPVQSAVAQALACPLR